MKKLCFILPLFIIAGAVFAATVSQSASKSKVPVKAQEVVVPTPPEPKYVTAPPVEQPPEVNPITQAVVQQGILACTSRVNQVANFLTANTQSAALLVTSSTARPDQMLFSTSFELDRPQMGTAYASATFAPNQNNGCGAVYETVEYGVASCPDIEKNLFSDLKHIGMIKKNVMLLESGSLKVFLMPAGTGCVVIKKEIVQ